MSDEFATFPLTLLPPIDRSKMYCSRIKRNTRQHNNEQREFINWLAMKCQWVRLTGGLCLTEIFCQLDSSSSDELRLPLRVFPEIIQHLLYVLLQPAHCKHQRPKQSTFTRPRKDVSRSSVLDELRVQTSHFLPSVLVSCCRRVLAVMTSIRWILQNRTTSLHSNWIR